MQECKGLAPVLAPASASCFKVSKGLAGCTSTRPGGGQEEVRSPSLHRKFKVKMNQSKQSKASNRQERVKTFLKRRHRGQQHTQLYPPKSILVTSGGMQIQPLCGITPLW